MDISNEELLKRVGKKLRDLRVLNKMGSYETFAFDNKLPRVTVYRMETGSTNFRIDTLVKMLDIHGISLQDFFKELDV